MRFRNPTRVAAVLTSGMLVMVACAIGAQQFSGDTSSAGNTARIVAGMITQRHISHAPIDDALSSKLLERFIKSLDPQKLYYSAADVEQLRKQRLMLDDQIKKGNVDFAFAAFNLYKKRLAERMEVVSTIIDMDHDFTLEEEMTIDADDLDWGKTDKEINDRWRKRIKYELLSLKLDDTSIPDARKRLHKRYHTLKSLMGQTERNEILEIYLSSLTHALDPHSSYMSPDTLKDFQIAMELKLEGIGAALRSEDGYTIVASIVPTGAAKADGRLKVGDKIVAVRSRPNAEWVDVVEMKLKHVVRMIRGPKNTKVGLRVKQENGDVAVYELTRQMVELTSAEVKGEIIEGERVGNRPGRIGVINIPSFYRDFRAASLGMDFKSTKKDVEKVLEDFERQGGVDAVVVDLRYNGGGALSEAIEVSGLFIPRGPIVQVLEQDGSVSAHADADRGEWLYRGPLVVLVNRLSASASEIFAGAIKDYKRGIVIGDSTTHGKGTVQNVMNVSSGMRLFSNESHGALKLTINKFYRVNGDSTQNRGVASDVTLPSLLEHRDIGESSLENALDFDRIQPSSHRQIKGFVSSDLITGIKRRSATRIAQDADFQKLAGDIAKFEERKNRKTVSLNEEVLKRELAEAKAEAAEAEEETSDQPEAGADGPVFPEHYYNEEVLKITLDYLDLWKEQRTAAR